MRLYRKKGWNRSEFEKERLFFMLLEDGIIWYHRPGGAPMHDDYQWYRLEEDEYRLMDTFGRYDWDLDGCYAENREKDVFFIMKKKFQRRNGRN